MSKSCVVFDFKQTLLPGLPFENAIQQSASHVPDAADNHETSLRSRPDSAGICSLGIGTFSKSENVVELFPQIQSARSEQRKVLKGSAVHWEPSSLL